MYQFPPTYSFPSPSSTGAPAPPPTATPSKVVHLRNVGLDITESELVEICGRSGTIENILMLKGKKQALIQFQDVRSASNLIERAAQNQLVIRSQQLFAQFSKHSEIAAAPPTASTSGAPARILLLTILNPMYDITVHTLAQIFSQYDSTGRGSVEKVVIFTKTTGLQALVQFAKSEDAQKARAALHGKNIYKGCCTLQIQNSNLPDLTVKVNTETSWDFTNPALPQKKNDMLLPRFGGDSGLIQRERDGMPGMGKEGMCVLLVSGFPPEKIGCEQLFNLFSNYGMIVRIKILRSKGNSAFIQFAEESQATQAMNFLKKTPIFGSTLEISFSHYSHITPISAATPTKGKGPLATEDGKTVEYEGSPLNRFMRYGASSSRALSAPSEVLHVSNVAPGVKEETLRALLQKAGSVSQVKLYEKEGKAMALAQFASVENAVQAMCLLHNASLEDKHIRLAFTRNRI